MYRLGLCLSGRQLERLSKKHLQLSAKSYSNLCRSRNQNIVIQSARNVSSAPKKKGGRFLFYTISLATLSTGGVILYAQYDPEFRAWLDENVAGSDKFIKVVLQEEKSIMDSTVDYLSDIKDQTITSAYKLIGFGDSSEKKDATPVQSRDGESKPHSSGKEVPKDSAKNQENASKVGTVDQPISKRDKEDKRSDLQPQTLTSFEIELNRCKRDAIKAYADSIQAVQEHSNAVYQLVEASVFENSPKIWHQVKQATEQKEKKLKIAQESAQNARQKLNRLKELVASSKIDASKDALATAKSNVNRAVEEVEKSKKLADKEIQTASVSDKYWKKVEEARSYFAEELRAYFPDIELSSNQIKLKEDDLNLFLFSAYQKVLYYQKELSKLETIGEKLLREAIEQVKSGNDITAAIEYGIELERRKLQEELQEKSLEVQVETDLELRRQLQRLAEAHHDHLTEALALKEKEMSRKVVKEIDERVSAEKEKYKASLAGMVGRMKGLTEAFEKRVEQDKFARQSLALWSACQSLLTAVNAWSPDVPWSEQLKPLKSEVEAIVKAGAKDELVEAIVKAIPNEALNRGVYPENALKQRFFNVERTAYRVAIVPEGGASLSYLLLSFLQSFLIIRAANPIPAGEIADQPIDVSTLDNYDILQRARYWLDRGDLAQTLKYMNLLEGGSRAVARDWMNEVRLLLETKQAAETLVFHSTSNGLIYS